MELLAASLKAALRPLQALMAAPSLLFIATMALMLFHPLDAPVRSYDRFAFGILVFVVISRTCVLQEPLRVQGPVTFPLMVLLVLAFSQAVAQPYKAETWSLFAAKWLIPLVLFQVAARIFDNPIALKRFEVFALLVLAYLSVISIFFLVGAKI